MDDNIIVGLMLQYADETCHITFTPEQYETANEFLDTDERRENVTAQLYGLSFIETGGDDGQQEGVQELQEDV